MPRPTATEELLRRSRLSRRAAWPAILLASPLGLLIAMIVFSELRMTAPAVVDAGAAGLASMAQPIARPEPVAVPAAIGGPALGSARPAPEPSRDGPTVPAATAAGAHRRSDGQGFQGPVRERLGLRASRRTFRDLVPIGARMKSPLPASSS